jgi:hypothetical protein
METGFEANEEAKEKIAEAEKQQAVYKKKSAEIYQKAVGILRQTKLKLNF